MKRVLMVTYHCPPALNAESILVWKTLRLLPDWHDVTVLTADDGGARDEQLGMPTAVRVKRYRTPRPAGAFTGRVADKLLGFAADERLLWALSGLRGDVSHGAYDVLYSRSHPGASHIFAWLIKRRLGLPWVAQFSDPWASNPYHSGHTKVRAQVDRYFEREVIRHADRLIFPTHEIQAMYERQYPGWRVAERAVILPHHLAPELYHAGSAGSTPDIADTADTVIRGAGGGTTGLRDGAGDGLALCYFGDFYGLRSPEPLIRAVQRLCADDPAAVGRLRLRFVGNIQPKFLPLLDQSPVPVATGRVSYLESLRTMAQSSVLVLLDAPNETGVNPFLPSKLIDYLGAMRPVLGMTETRGTAADILRRFGHPVIRPQDIDGIRRQIAQWLEQPPQPPQRAAEEFYSAQVVGQLASILEDMG